MTAPHERNNLSKWRRLDKPVTVLRTWFDDERDGASLKDGSFQEHDRVVDGVFGKCLPFVRP